MSRVSLARRAITVTAASMMLMGAMLVPLAGTVGAAQASTTCPPNNELETAHYCILKISSPNSVQTGVPFTVKVFITLDGTTVAKNEPCASKATVQLVVTQGGDPIYLAQAKAGVATFSVTVNSQGTWFLDASVPTNQAGCEGYQYQTDSRTIQAVELQPGEPMAPCPPDVSCAQATSHSGTQATMFANSGTFDPLFPGYFGATIPGGDCPGGPRNDPNGVLGFQLTGQDPSTTTKTIIFALDSSLVTQGIGKFNVCWSANAAFTSNTGVTVLPGQSGNLPDCKQGTAPPCVDHKNSGPHNVAFITVIAPAQTDPDPFGYGH